MTFNTKHDLSTAQRENKLKLTSSGELSEHSWNDRCQDCT